MIDKAAKAIRDKPKFKGAFSSFSIDDIEEAKKFYDSTLGLDVKETDEGLEITFASGESVFIYSKDDHKPAKFTVLNLIVDDIATAVDQLKGNGIEFESYGGAINTDENDIFWGGKENKGPNIAWFRDPAGNFISVIEG